MAKISRWLPLTALAGLAIGGGLYTIGTIFYLWKSLPYHHPIWHVFVLAGSICHFFCILWYVME